MSNRQNPLYWSFGLGTWLGVRIRISWLMPVVLAWFLFEFNLKLGGALFGIFLVSVLLHEFGHIFAARAVDGSGDEVLLWPLGGLAFVEHSSSPRAQFITAIGGPAVNFVLCGLSLPGVYVSGKLGEALNPLALPDIQGFGRENLARDLQLIVFSVNWMLLLVNLLPAYPLDGGQMVRSVLTARLGHPMGTEIAVKCGLFLGVLLAVVAMLAFKHVLLLGIAFLIVIMAMQESYQLQSGEAYDDSFMGYDFSQGYTSLERSEQSKPQARPGLLARWRLSRRAEKQRRLEQQQLQVDQQLDALLAKVHERGLTALTPSERRLLKRASDRYRSKGQEPS